MAKRSFRILLPSLCETTMSGTLNATQSAEGMSQSITASQARSRAATAATEKAHGDSKVRQTATEGHRATRVRKEMVKVPLMKLKVNVQMTRGHTRPRDEDTVLERYQILVASPPN